MQQPQNNPKGQSDAAKDEEQFPGYPHYDAKDDITNKYNGAEQVSTNPDQLGPYGRHNSTEQRDSGTNSPRATDDNTINSSADVTEEDKQMLSAADQNRDMDDTDLEEAGLDATDDDGDPLNEPSSAYGQTGADLDVPGSEDDDANEDIGEEDEENNYYSLGGDNHESLEEDNDI